MSHDLNPSTAVAPAPSPVANPAPTRRLGSIDAFRGFVMFLMMAEVLRLNETAPRWERLRSRSSPHGVNNSRHLARLAPPLEPRRSAVLISALATGPPAGVGGRLGPFLAA